MWLLNRDGTGVGINPHAFMRLHSSLFLTASVSRTFARLCGEEGLLTINIEEEDHVTPGTELLFCCFMLCFSVFVAFV